MPKIWTAFPGGAWFLARSRILGSVDSVNRSVNIDFDLRWYFNRFRVPRKCNSDLFKLVDNFFVRHPSPPSALKARSSEKTEVFT